MHMWWCGLHMCGMMCICGGVVSRCVLSLESGMGGKGWEERGVGGVKNRDVHEGRVSGGGGGGGGGWGGCPTSCAKCVEIWALTSTVLSTQQ